MNTQDMNTQDLTKCNFPTEDCLIIGQDEGGYYTDTGYITDAEAKEHGFQRYQAKLDDLVAESKELLK